MSKKPKVFKYRFSKHGEELVTMNYVGWKRWEVYYKGKLIDSFKYALSMSKEFKKGRSYSLDDGSNLVLRYIKRGTIYFWEPCLDGKLAYTTLKQQHNYIWGSWAALSILIPVLLILQSIDVRGAEEVLAILVPAIFLINMTCAILAKIRWKPIAWIAATLYVADISLAWVFFADNPVGMPPIMETIGIIVFRDFLVNAKFIWNVLDKVSEYENA